MTDTIRGELLPVLPLRDIVVFPHMIVPLFVGREKSVRALEAVMKDDKQILLVAQKNAAQDDPGADDLYQVGTVSTVLQLLKLPDGTVKVLVEGGRRAKIAAFKETANYFEAFAEVVEETVAEPREAEALARTVVSQFEQYIKLNKKIAPEVLVSINQIEEPAKLADTVASHLGLKIPEKQELLETPSVTARLERVFAHMEGEIGVLQVEKRIRNRVKRQMEKTQREYYLNEQLKAIQKELGEGEDGKDEAAELEARIKATKLQQGSAREGAAGAQEAPHHEPDVRRGDGGAQLPRLDAVDPVEEAHQGQATTSPWPRTFSNADHYGLEKVKERIIEYLAVQSRSPKIRGPILCLVGPPGVGKTSLGKSIAKATGRNFVRMSLGGVRDEAEVRGHRRTYIGSMPGKVIQGMKKAKTSNPLFLLDEIDKLGADWRGDPSSALLEVLDPEQNSTFADHYLEVDYDLSDVMFVTTANTLRMPQPLLDRMEIIRIPGYTEDEKVEIAKRHLMKQVSEANGLKDDEWSLSEDAMRDLVRYYTREAGVRNLEREIASLARKAVKEIVSKKAKKVAITAQEPREVRRRAEVPLRRGRGRGHGGRRHRPGLDRGGRRDPDHRERDGARQGQGEDHRQARRRDAGERLGGDVLCPLARDHLRHQADAVREARHPRARAGGRDAEGRPVGRHRHGDLDRVGAHRHPGAARRRHDGRDHAARPGAADRRPEGEAAGGAARGHQDGLHPEGQREGPGRDPGQREEGPRTIVPSRTSTR